MSGAIIRDVTNADVQAVTAIYGWVVENETGSYELEPPDENEIRQRILSIIKDKYPYIVLEVDGQVRGYACVSPFRTRPGYRYTAETTVYVHNEFTSQGFGKQLLAELIKRCEKREYKQLIGIIGDAENSASIGLHKSFGFQKAGELKRAGHKFGKWLDLIIMQKSLGGDS